jgi:hypothetical protein
MVAEKSSWWGKECPNLIDEEIARQAEEEITRAAWLT